MRYNFVGNLVLRITSPKYFAFIIKFTKYFCSVVALTVLYVHLLGDVLRTGFGKAVSGCQHPVLTHDGSKA